MRTTSTITPMRRGLVLALAAVVGFATHAVTFTVAAEAALPDHLGTGEFTAFEIDGDIAGANDWQGNGYGAYTTAQGRPSAGIVGITQEVDLCETPGDDYYLGAIEGVPFPWPTDTGNVNRKNDICEFGTALEIVEVDGAYHHVLYGYYARPGNATGDQSALFVLDKPDTQVGDVIIAYDYDPSGTSGFFKVTWDGTNWIPEALTDGVQGAAGPNPFVTGANPDTFAEFAIDLTTNGIFPPVVDGAEQCSTFQSGGFATYTGNDSSSSLADRAAPANPLPVSNCTDVEIIKAANVDAPGTEFLYQLDQADGGTVHDATLVPPPGVSDVNTSTSAIDANIEVGETHLWQNVVASPDYQLQELPAAGWDLVDITCTWYDPFLETTRTEVVTTGPDGTIVQQFQIPPTIMDGGVTTSCVLTNETSGLVVVKEGAGDPTADFSFAVTGAPASPYTLSLGESTGVLAFDPGTTVTITETLPGAAPAWVYDGASCLSDADGATPIEFGPTDDVVIDTVGGEVITCTFTNTQNSQVNVLKTGEPADSTDDFGFDTTYVGPLDGVADFTLQIDDPANNSGDLAPGTYTVEELIDATNVTADPDFVLADITCAVTTAGEGTSTFTYGGDGTFDPGDTDATIDLAAGDVVDCTFTNEQAGRLVVVKETDGADDTFTFTGAVTGDITTTAAATAPGDELVADVPAGTYAVDELIPAGWDLADASCDNGTGTFATGEDSGGLADIGVAAGETVSCTFTNQRETATLTLTKLWSPSAATGDAVGLRATGDDPVAGETSVGLNTVGGSPTDEDAVITIHPGEEVLLEEFFSSANVANYDTLLGCDAAGLTYTDGDTTGTFSVPGDDPVDVTCTFANERQTAQLTLEKAWVNGADGDVATLSASGDSGLEPVAAGDSTVGGADNAAVLTIYSGETVTLDEVLGAGNTGTYDTTFTCTDAAGVTYTEGALTATYDVPVVPVDVTCTFTNTRTETTLTLDKTWTNPAAGDSVDLAISGEAGEGTGTVAGDGSTDTPATLTVYSGEVVDLAEAFAPGDPSWYATDLTCSAGDLTYTADDLTGTLGITATPTEGIACTFANVRETAQVIVAKDVAPDTDSGLFDLSVDGVVVAPDAGDGDASPPAEVLVGDPVTVSEVAGTGTDLANYDSSLACDSGIVPDPNTGTSGEFTVLTADATVTCTFTNTRKSAQMVVTKDWVNGADGDAVTLSAQGNSGNSPAGAGGSVAPDTDTDVVLTVWAGETVGIAEAYDLGNVGSYTADLSCTDATGLTYTPGATSGSYLVPATPVDVTCTFLNTRTSAELTLQKEWVDGAPGDTADLDVTATLGSAPVDGATSTADGTLGSVVDTANVVTAEVLSGETVTLDEVLGAENTGSYDSELSCDGAGLDPEPTTGTSGSYTMPLDPAPVTCTFTNTRTRVNLTLEKEWVDATAGDTAILSFFGAVTAPFGESTATGAAGSEVDTPVASGEVLSGETVTMNEVLGAGNEGVYASSLACDGGAPIGETSGEFTVPSDATEDITCRFTNVAGRGNIVIVKNVEGADGTFDFQGNWPDPATGDTAIVGDFQITTDGGSGSVVYTGVLVPRGGTYTVIELDPTPEYDGTNLVCVDPDGGSSVDGLTGIIDLDPGETVTCTYTNTQRSTITVVKDAVPDDDQVFGYTTSGAPLPDTFDLVDDGTDTANTFTSDLVPASATYSVTEATVPGWTLSSATCDNGDTPDAITPAPGTNVTCTFVNVADPGRVTVTKTVEGVADDYAWSFDIAIDPVDPGVTSPQPVSGVGQGTDAVTFEPLTLNQTYTIDEPVLPPGWEQTSFECAGVPDEDSAAPGYQVTITEPDQTIDCAIVNTAVPSSVEVTKTVSGVADGYAWSFDFTISPVPDGGTSPKTASGTGDGTDSVTWADLVPGETYTIAEVPLAGFTAGALACTGVDDVDGDPTDASVTFVAPFGGGEGIDVACAITNTAVPSSVEVTKTVSGVADGYAWSFDFTISPVPDGGTSPLTASGTGDGSATVGWTDLVPGETYTIAEVPVLGGVITAELTCVGADDLDDDPATVTFVAPLGTGEGPDITCSITNAPVPGSLTITKSTVGGDGTFTFTITPEGGDPVEYEVTTTGGTGEVTVEGLPAGQTYTVAEVDPGSSWIAGELTCTVTRVDGSVETVDPAVGFEVRVADEVACAIENTARGDLTIDKSVASTTIVGSGFTVTYTLVVSGDSPVDEPYTVDDELSFGDGIEIDTVSASSADGAVNPGWDGVTTLTLTDGEQVLPAGATHTYSVVVTGTVTGDATSESIDCVLTEGEDGTGLLNTATVTYGGGSDTDDACDTPELPSVGLELTAPQCVADVPYLQVSVDLAAARDAFGGPVTLHWVLLDPAGPVVTSPATGPSAGDTVYLFDPATSSPSTEPLRGTIELSQVLTDEQIETGVIPWAGVRFNADGVIVEYPGFETVFAVPGDDTSGIVDYIPTDGNFAWSRTAENIGLFVTVNPTSAALTEEIVAVNGETLAYPDSEEDCVVDAVIEVDKTNDADGDGTFTDVEVADTEGADVPFEVVVSNPGPWAGQVRLFDTLDDGTTLFLFGQDPADSPDVVTTCVRDGSGGAFGVDDALAVGESITCNYTLPDYAPASGSQRINTVTAELVLYRTEDGELVGVDLRDDDTDTSSVGTEDVVTGFDQVMLVPLALLLVLLGAGALLLSNRWDGRRREP